MPNTPFNMMIKQDHSKSVYKGDFKNLASVCTGTQIHQPKVSTADRIIMKQLGRNLCCNAGTDGTACGLTPCASS
jgi:hypothetical protein